MNDAFIQGFRHAAPYINTHREQTFVLAINGAAISQNNFKQLVHDIAVLHSLGIRLIVTHGFRHQIDIALEKTNIDTQFHKGLRVTDKETLNIIEQIAGQTRIQIEAAFSKSQEQSPLQGNQLKLCSGNFVSAKPMGVIDGIDMQHTGSIRKIDNKTINNNLSQGQIVLLSTLAYSSTGETFNLSLYELAVETALATHADKLIIFQSEEGFLDHDHFLIRQICTHQSNDIQAKQQDLYQHIATAVNNGIKRAHILSFNANGALLQELFTHIGAGTLISQDEYELSRQADINDINHILELIEPLENSGVLVKRSRALLENEINYFTVIECDQRIIACAALYPYANNSAEIACIVTHPNYQKQGLAARLLKLLENKARLLECNQVFVLSTQTTHWFKEQGFQDSPIDTLPTAKKDLYNYSRNAKVLSKPLKKS